MMEHSLKGLVSSLLYVLITRLVLLLGGEGECFHHSISLPRTELGTQQSLNLPRVRQMLDSILKEYPLEEGVQLIPICSGICGLQYRLSCILRTPLRMMSYLKGMNWTVGCKTGFRN